MGDALLIPNGWGWNGQGRGVDYLPEGTKAAAPKRKGQCWASVAEKGGRLRQCKQRARKDRLTCVGHVGCEADAQKMKAAGAAGGTKS